MKNTTDERLMLWYKAWRETEVRFTISMLAMAAICLVFISLYKSIIPQFPEIDSWTAYVYEFAYSGYAKAVFLVCVLLLGLGGLRQEQGPGTAGFTLALPVSRRRLVTVRAAVGLLEIVALASLPLILVPSISPLAHQSYPFSQSLQFFLLWIGCGAAVFAEAFFFSAVLSGEYSALVVSFTVLFLHPFVARALRPYFLNLFAIMSARSRMPNHHTYLMSGPFPWAILFCIVVLAFVLLAGTTRVVEKQDY